MDKKEDILKKLIEDLNNCNIGYQNAKRELDIHRRQMRISEEERVRLSNEIDAYYIIKKKLISKEQKLFSVVLLLAVVSTFTGVRLNILLETTTFSTIVSSIATLIQEIINDKEKKVIRTYPILDKEKTYKMLNKLAINNKEKEIELESSYIEEYQKHLKIASSIDLLKKEPHDNDLYLEKQYVKTYKRNKE